MPRESLELRVTSDFEAMRSLGERAGWEAGGAMAGIVVAYGWFVGGRLVGCAALQVLDGHYYIEYVAVESEMRGRGLGASLVAKIEDEARSRGLRALWAKARLPGFYERLGYSVQPARGHGPKSIDGCEGCSQYQRSCHPAMVVKPL